MKKFVLSLSLAAGVIGLAACNGGDGEVLVSTSAGDVTKEELYSELKTVAGQQALQQLVIEKVLADKYEVTEEEVNAKVEEVKQELGANFEMALAQSGLADEDALKETFRTGMLQEKAAIADIEVTEEEVKEFYENQKPEIQASHILVADMDTAKEVQGKIDAGGDFAELAKEYSTDPGSAENGGDLGFFGTGVMDPAFEEAAYALEVGEVSEPVETQFGVHIIKLTDKKEKQPFEEVKEKMENDLKVSKLTPDVIQAAMARELKAAKVDIKDEDLKTALDQYLNFEAPAEGGEGQGGQEEGQTSEESTEEK
ncbi:peptidylprolyl isomerase [Mangrovibacillus cuniculi]|uniref:Foldase protein PrsA n=1 Tax=Mangrovibacillus cuniculi TaxID=2593652 RepID=A0A7S8C9P0_9BACI|nr:peptidylprolyl isomerase [Mangrovibacillus cuniculi]QPC45985.1 peptidylprolyl isomerase PrsA [Mangrovibacillus cuniculi]